MEFIGTLFLVAIGWASIGLVVMFLFIEYVMFMRRNEQSRLEAFLMHALCPFPALRGAYLDQSHEARQRLYLLSLLGLWPLLLLALPWSLRGYHRENG